MKPLISQKSITEYNFNDALAGKYIFAVQSLHAGTEIPLEIQQELSKAGLYSMSTSKLRVFNYKKPKKEKIVIDTGGNYNKKDFVQGMLTSDVKIHKILGLYFLLTDPQMPTLQIAQSFISRHIKDASVLTPWFENDETKATLKSAMISTYQHSKEMNYNMTLGTVYKRLTSE